MKRFKVIAEKGVFLNGKKNPKGSVVTGELKQAHIQTALHFKQIVELPAEAPEPDPEAEAKAKAEAYAKAAEEAAAAEAAAKAEAEAKAKKK